jgi:hypothetical protein
MADNRVSQTINDSTASMSTVKSVDAAGHARRISGIVGPYLEDRTTLKFAHLVERDLGGFIPPPSL